VRAKRAAACPAGAPGTKRATAFADDRRLPEM
jgi:hypothetical protein